MPEVCVFAPATVANVACGFDVLGFAIGQLGDEVRGRKSDTPGITIREIVGDGGKLPLDPEKNTASIAALATIRYGIANNLLPENFGLEISIEKKMPIGSGLGSSSASAVAGAVLVNAFFSKPLPAHDLLPFALEGEAFASGGRHADNVAPALMGGITLVRDHEQDDVLALPVPARLWAAIVFPHIEILTREARAILSKTVPLNVVTRQSANLGAFVAGLYSGDHDLLHRALRDVMIEPQRAPLIPHFYEVKDAALQAGALGCSISGSGPAMFALTASEQIAQAAVQSMRHVFERNGIQTLGFVSAINKQGATVSIR